MLASSSSVEPAFTGPCGGDGERCDARPEGSGDVAIAAAPVALCSTISKQTICVACAIALQKMEGLYLSAPRALYIRGLLVGLKPMVYRRDSNVPGNRILNAMSNADLALLQPHLEKVPLKLRQRLQSSHRSITNVYFPDCGIASVVAVGGGERRQAEVAVIGREGMTGLPVVYGTDRSPCDIFMQVEGHGHCIGAQKLRQALDQSLTLFRCLLRYAHALSVQANYTALANARGCIEEKLARWLLMARDRLDCDEMILTHEFLALMLGVRRAGVSEALQAFEVKGLVQTARGSVTILDREGLEECANGLYGVPEADYERVLGCTEKGDVCAASSIL